MKWNFIREIELDYIANIPLDLRGLANGVYIISLETKDGIKIPKKIIIAN